MGVIRNFIEVLGLAQEENLPEKSFGQLIKYNEAEHIIIPREKLGIKDIYQVGLKVDIKSKRTVNTQDSKTVILDGIKSFKIMCTEYENPDKVVMLNLQQPYNTFVEVPQSVKNIDNIYIHILDAYFEVLDKRRIYGHFVYLVDVRYPYTDLEIPTPKNENKAQVVSVVVDRNNSETQIALSHEDFTVWDVEDKNIVQYNDDIDCEYL